MPTNTCKNCDKPMPHGGDYCSIYCAAIDGLPAPRDDMEAMTALVSMKNPPKCPLCLDRGGMDPCPECGKETVEPAPFEENCTFVLGRWSIEASMFINTSDAEAQATLAHLSPLIERLLDTVVASMVPPKGVTFRVDC